MNLAQAVSRYLIAAAQPGEPCSTLRLSQLVALGRARVRLHERPHWFDTRTSSYVPLPARRGPRLAKGGRL